MTAVVALTVTGPVAPWRAIGLRIDDGVASIGGIALRFADVAADEPTTTSATTSAATSAAQSATTSTTRVASWTLAGSPDRAATIDGLATEHVESLDSLGTTTDLQMGDHPLGVTSFDHLVVMTSSLERTCGEIERVTGEPLKRIREAGPVRQGFHRLGHMIVEVVESSQVTSSEASFWGFVFIVDDLHEVADRLGPDVLSIPKAAVQPGRFIASFRASVGLGLPIALMTPDRR